MKKILVAPLNWGLGHATRCIPIINALLQEGFTPVIASDGDAKALLQKEFPTLESIELPSYNIKYAKKGSFFKFKMLFNSPKIVKAIQLERKATKKILTSDRYYGIISDNRMGVRHKDIPSVFITHQLTVLSGKTTKISTKLHNKYIKKFDACWVPDMATSPNLSGALGHPKKAKKAVSYIGPISRFSSQQTPIENDIMVLLSGPEPQRTMLEEKLLKELKESHKKILFVRGLIEDKQHISQLDNITIYNFLLGKEIEHAINSSELIISRSGYTTVMDLAKLQKKAFFIPTPGQFEQEYIAKRLTEQKIVPSCKQKEFSLSQLDTINEYSGLTHFESDINFGKLFHLFQGK
ncbi:glycosyltransferase [Aquimarina rhabdastrellae]